MHRWWPILAVCAGCLRAAPPGVPAPPAEEWVGQKDDKAAAALAKPVDVDFRDTPLDEAAEALSTKLGISVVLDDEALADAKVEPDRPVTLSLRGVPARQALSLILEPLGLLAIPENDVLRIADREGERENPALRVYPVADLLAAGGDREGSAKLLVEAIEGAIDTDTWKNNGGADAIAFVPMALALAVSAPYETQERTLELLRLLRRAQGLGRAQFAAAGGEAGFQEFQAKALRAFRADQAPAENPPAAAGNHAAADAAQALKAAEEARDIALRALRVAVQAKRDGAAGKAAPAAPPPAARGPDAAL